MGRIDGVCFLSDILLEFAVLFLGGREENVVMRLSNLISRLPAIELFELFASLTVRYDN